MHAITEYLKVLELTDVPDEETLKEQFNRLLKVYHPDRNLNQPDWAHEKTMKLIEANRVVSGYSKKRKFTYIRNAAPQFTYGSPSPRTSNHKEIKYYTYQLIRGEESAYAVSVMNIHRILHADQTEIKSNLFGYYCRENDTVYPILNPDGRIPAAGKLNYLIFLKTGKAIGFHERYEFEKIQEITDKEIIRSVSQEALMLIYREREYRIIK